MRRLAAVLMAAAALGVGLVALPPAHAADAATARTPVVFVHGYMALGADWPTAKSTFGAGGYTSAELHTFSYDYNQSNEKSAAQLAAFVSQVRSKTGAAKVDLVSHSMGGMVTRWYVKQLGGQAYVSHWASLAGANHGTSSANSCAFYSAACKEMKAGSAFLTKLNSGDETPGAVKYATWYSASDGIISPYTSTPVTGGATNTLVKGVTHLQFLSDTAVLGQVRAFLAA